MGYFQVRREYPGDNLRSTRYDRVSSLLLAMLTVTGTVFLVLLGLWAAPHKQDEVVIVYQPKLVYGEVEEEAPFEFETPSPSELPGVPLIQTPALFADSMAEAMTLMTAIEVEEIALDPTGQREMGGVICGSFVFGPQPAAPAIPTTELPKWERWEIQYVTTSIDVYAKQLDHFGIELGAAGGGKVNVDYAKVLTAESPEVRAAPGAEDTRLYMTWRDGDVKKFDTNLLQRAGVSVKGRLVLQFFPRKIEERLADLEREHAGDRPLKQLLKTVFGVRISGDEYEFFVKEQKYR